MRGHLRVAVAAVGMIALAAPASAMGGAPPISVQDDDFLPPETLTSVGNNVTWDWDAGNVNEHNVVQDAKLFKSGAPATVDTPFQVSPSAGKFPYYCEVHGNKGGLGMAGKLKVAPEAFPLKAAHGGDFAFGVQWAVGTDTGNQFDVQYRVDDGKWKNWKKNTSNPQGEFGNNDKPVNVRPGKTYGIRARSEKSSNPKKKRSGWSPKLIVVIP